MKTGVTWVRMTNITCFISGTSTRSLCKYTFHVYSATPATVSHFTWFIQSSSCHLQSTFRKKFHLTLHILVGNRMVNANSPNAQLRVSISNSFHIASLWGNSLLFNIKLISLLVLFFFFLAYQKVLICSYGLCLFKFFPPTFSPTFLRLP